jgi:hypothetical protein
MTVEFLFWVRVAEPVACGQHVTTDTVFFARRMILGMRTRCFNFFPGEAGTERLSNF